MKNRTIPPSTKFLYLILGIIGMSALTYAASLYTMCDYINSGCETLSKETYNMNMRYILILAGSGFVYIIGLLMLYIKLLRDKSLQLSEWNKAGVWCLLVALLVPMAIDVTLSVAEISYHAGVATASSYFFSILAIIGFFLLVFKTDLPIISKIVLVAWKPALVLVNICMPAQTLSTLEAWKLLCIEEALYLALDVVVIVCAFIAFKVKKAPLQPSSIEEETFL